ncbi:MAG: beta-ketoacyl-[acyl-carrier-protein] synthase II [Lachnospiraceae bacterium]|nr:beta-ketoacyl-[acyl-carrier-protein] synthase II [Lachnospiraceae bacterium]
MNRRVVVTGMGVISPIGNNLEEFWNALLEGKCGIGPITKFDTTEYKAKLAAEVKDFNARDYMEKAEMLRSDLYAQYGLASACQAVEDSKIIGTVEPERIGVYYGTGIGGMDTFMTEHKKLIEKGTRKVSPYFVPMMIANMASGMIAIRFNCKGAAMPSVTACASGSNAIGEALRAIRHGYLDAVITGGAEAPINECGVSGFVNMQALSTAENPNEASLPFDSRRGGFVIGEGGAALVLEEYEHAVARGAHIYGEVCGYGSTCDAYHITAPHPEAEGGARAMVEAMKEAGYTGKETVYVNAHGTGTPLNDVIETSAIKIAFTEEKAKDLYISSTKSMTGHMLGAAGAAEAIACLKAIEEGIIPPTINLLSPDEKCDLNYVPNKPVKVDVDLAFSNSLGFGGHNACLAFRKV